MKNMMSLFQIFFKKAYKLEEPLDGLHCELPSQMGLPSQPHPQWRTLLSVQWSKQMKNTKKELER